MSASNWFIGCGLLVVAAAGGLLAYRGVHAPAQPVTLTCAAPPAPVVNVTAPPSKPYVCTPEQAEAGECLPLLQKQDRESVTKTPLDVVHAMPKPRPKPKPKKKRSAVAKLKSKWGIQ